MNKLVPVLLLTLCLLSACGQSGNKEGSSDKPANSQNGNTVTTRFKPERSGKIVAKVNGVPIYEDELNGRPVKSLITDEILYQEGLKEGIDKKYQDKVMQYQMSLVVKDVKSSILENMPPEKEVTDKELLDYYNQHKDLNYTNLRIQEINFSDKKLGDEILKMAQAGKELQDIANSMSNSGSKVTVNDLGFDKRLSPYFKVKEVGAVTEVISKQDGTYSVLKILEVKEVPFDTAKNVLKYTVESRQKGMAYEKYADKIAKENGMKIEIVTDSGQK